jgi:hypothetical protein
VGDPSVHKGKKARLGISLDPLQPSLSLGDDVMLPEVLSLAEKAVVGHTNGRFFSHEDLSEWVSFSWKDLGIKIPSVHSLAKGWFMLKFHSTFDVCRILGEPWSIDSTPLLLKRWTHFFDANHERIDELPIWVRLPWLPPE